MSTVEITFFDHEGRPFQMPHKVILVPGEIMEGYEIRVDGQPLVRQSFSIHGPSYHTICSVTSDAIEVLERDERR
jgi:hypothetical protein